MADFITGMSAESMGALLVATGATWQAVVSTRALGHSLVAEIEVEEPDTREAVAARAEKRAILEAAGWAIICVGSWTVAIASMV